MNIDRPADSKTARNPDRNDPNEPIPRIVRSRPERSRGGRGGGGGGVKTIIVARILRLFSGFPSLRRATPRFDRPASRRTPKDDLRPRAGRDRSARRERRERPSARPCGANCNSPRMQSRTVDDRRNFLQGDR